MTNEAGNQEYISAETVPLLPCPFCGEKRIFLNAPNKHDRYGSINCPACMVVMPGAVSDQTELVRCWNTRACWRPIDAAPRDGTRILAFGGGLTNQAEVVSYNAEVGAWNAPNDTLDDRDDEPDGYCRPTHWMPLPSPPQETP